MLKLAQFPQFAPDYYELIDGKLFRKQVNGKLKQVTLLDRERLICNFAGEIYRAVDIAWMLIYGIFPTCNVICLDGDPLNLTPENLVPVRTVRHRCHPLQYPNGWKHKLSEQFFGSVTTCASDWLVCAQSAYRSDRVLIVREEAKKLELLRANSADIPRPAFFPKPFVPKRRISRAAKGARPSLDHVWHKDTEQWVKVPPACCTADDIQVRAGYVLQGFSEFAYDLASNRVKPVK